MSRHYLAVARRANHRCEYCRAPESTSNSAFEVDHIVPVSQAGSDELANLALACRACNLSKSGGQLGRDEAGNEIPLFNPRTDRWKDHFDWDLERGEILGLTPTGRATIEHLRMNEPRQISARLIWIEFRLFP